MSRRPRTYLLLVSPNETRGRRFVRLSAASVLQWFQRMWTLAHDDDALREELQGDVYGLGALFAAVHEHNIVVPASEPEMASLLTKHIYYERDIDAEPHFVHVETDDDEVDIEYFLFDEVFLAGDDALDRLPKAGRRKDRYARLLDEVRTENQQRSGVAQ